MKQIVIIGAGGFGREAAWIIKRINAVAPTFQLLGFCDDAPERQTGTYDGIPLLGAVERVPAGTFCFCAIGKNATRLDVLRRAEKAGLLAATLIDPTAVTAPDAEIGAGSFVGIHAVVSVGCRLGRGTIVNHGVCIGHDVTAGDGCQFCPGVCVSGGCTLGGGVLMGTLAGMIPLKKAGDASVIGAGTVPLRDVPPGETIARIR
ncbi:MAG: NeuD/PglB/VioB family sugar acetyltransferase [Kiritimatiellae bacterium]|nr:NeuD/PglB/VioB family sugar acetyltransferase [Kiritimatiellia bacterium]